MAVVCLPIQLHLSEGQASDCREAEGLLAAVPNGTTFLTDKAYDSDAIRSRITAQGAFANIPTKLRVQQFSLPLSQSGRTALR